MGYLRYPPEPERPDWDDLPHTTWACEVCGKENSCLDGQCQYPHEVNMYKVYYMRPEAFSRFISGYVTPTLAELDQTHVLVKEVESDSLENVFMDMQAENWSPEGEARPLIERLGLSHTSMSVGDIIEQGGVYYAVRPVGFVPIGK